MKTAGEVPASLVSWMKDRGATHWVSEENSWPGLPNPRRFVLTAVNLDRLGFDDHTYNPRTPSKPKVNEILASVRQLSMLTPLTCAFIEDGGKEPVVLIDGRHRFSALEQLIREDPRWGKTARIDLKIFHDLQKSDLHILATFLNRSRRPLKRGEYYRAIVKMFEEKKLEIESETGRPATERSIFNGINARELTNRDFDLSIGRVVGLTAFDDEEADSWYPLVGNHQHEKFLLDKSTFYCPLTAGNLAEFLSYLCLPKPYDDTGGKRAVELTNTVQLGERFRTTVLTEPTKSHRKITVTTVACKFWCMSAFGKLMSSYSELPARSPKTSIFSSPELDWKAIGKLLQAYADVMREQAKIVRRIKDTQNPDFLVHAWSYQTQSEQVRVPLMRALQKQGFSFREK